MESSFDKDRRAAARGKTIKSGLIIYDQGRCTMTCGILELSSGGAKLHPQDPGWVPEYFELQFSDGSRRHCELVRKDRNDIAVRFIETMTDAPEGGHR